MCFKWKISFYVYVWECVKLNKISNSEHVSRYTSQLKIVGSSNDPISGMVGEHETLMEGFIPFWSHVSNDASTYLNEVQFSGPSAAAEPAILPTPKKKMKSTVKNASANTLETIGCSKVLLWLNFALLKYYYSPISICDTENIFEENNMKYVQQTIFLEIIANWDTEKNISENFVWNKKTKVCLSGYR